MSPSPKHRARFPVPGLRAALVATATAMLALAAAPARATTLNFDDLPGDGQQAIADGYGGLRFLGAGSIATTTLPGTGYAHAATSGANSAFSWDGGAMVIERDGGGRFSVAGAWFTSAYQAQELVFEGWRDGVLVLDTPDSVVIDTDAPVWVGLGWTGIDRLVIANSANHWAMDDLQLTLDVPEPGSAVLLAVALAGLRATRRRRAAPPGAPAAAADATPAFTSAVTSAG